MSVRDRGISGENLVTPKSSGSIFDLTLVRRVSRFSIGEACESIQAHKPHPAVDVRRPAGGRYPGLQLINHQELEVLCRFLHYPHIPLTGVVDILRQQLPTLDRTKDIGVGSIRPFQIKSGASFIMLVPSEEELEALTSERDELRLALDGMIANKLKRRYSFEWHSRPLDITMAYIPSGVPEKVVDATCNLVGKVVPDLITLERATSPRQE